MEYSTGLKCKVQLPCAIGEKEDATSLEKISPWPRVRESVCVKSLKKTELNRLPKVHITT